MVLQRPILRLMIPLAGTALLISLAAVLSAQTAKPADKPAGEEVFRTSCTSCHGAKGEGAKGYPKPLTGTKSVGQLAKFISTTMPPGPKKCPAEDAQKVAAYIYDAFYSPLAQERNRPARVALSRLTVRQFRNAVTDLIGSFRPAGQTDEKRGLHPGLFKTGNSGNGQPLPERRDPE